MLGGMVTLYHSVRTRKPSVMMTQGPILRYCPACQHTSRTPLLYNGSRYGHVGGFECERCGARVNMVDRDCYPPVQYFARQTPDGPTATETILYEDLYRINEPDFRQIERWTGLTLLRQEDEKALAFEPLVAQVADEVARRALPLQTAAFSRPFVTWVPEPFQTWLNLYATLERA
ncbi:hypothetical protein GO986_03295 [Deinococcus sp. HMF7620]|uniref:Uncharacterized protein n=1 Tax=Deinococcus arboris TaxID=2682977 RepID=A0A7C9M4J0_9DEIO|nr:hypothetical protein [Deinococcus arboris]MVN85785.1 hypothetical protein [Deinococcus arboris]